MSISPVDKYIYFINICNIPYSIIKHLFERNSVYIYIWRDFPKTNKKNPSKTSVICFCKLTFPIYIYMLKIYLFLCWILSIIQSSVTWSSRNHSNSWFDLLLKATFLTLKTVVKLFLAFLLLNRMFRGTAFIYFLSLLSLLINLMSPCWILTS